MTSIVICTEYLEYRVHWSPTKPSQISLLVKFSINLHLKQMQSGMKKYRERMLEDFQVQLSYVFKKYMKRKVLKEMHQQ